MLGTNDIVFGIILSGRIVPVEKAHSILAPCITTIPQRISVTSQSSLRSILLTSQKGFVEPLEYQHTALRDIHKWVKAERPLFGTLYSYTRKQKNAPWSHLWHEVESSMPSEFPLAVEFVADHGTDRLIARCDFTTAFGTSEKANSLLQKLEQSMQSLAVGDESVLPSCMPSEHAPSVSTKLVNGKWNGEENLMRDIKAEVVGLEPENVAADTSFFTLGLDSIVAIQFVRKLRQVGVQCSSAEVMRFPSINELAQHTGSRGRSSPSIEKPITLKPQLPVTGSNLDSGISETYPCTPLQSTMLTQTLGQTVLFKGSFVFRDERHFTKPPWVVNALDDVCVFSLHYSLYDGESMDKIFSDLSGTQFGQHAYNQQDALRSIQRTSGESQAHQYASLSKIQQTWRDRIANPDAELFDTLFVFQKSATDVRSRAWTSIDIDEDTAPTEYATNFAFEQRKSKIALCVNSNRKENLEEFPQVFEIIMCDSLQHPKNAISEIFDDLPSHLITPASDNVKRPNIQSRVNSYSFDTTLAAVLTVLAEVSNIPSTNISDNASIFSLGLNSLSAIQIATRGRKQGLNVNVADILQADDSKSGMVESSTRSTSTSLPSTDSDNLHTKAIAFAGVRDEDVEAVLPCLPGQSYHLALWLRCGRTLGEATFTYTCREK
ncbi:hypothetical protein ACLMJK_002836 [Lecanora helva]